MEERLVELEYIRGIAVYHFKDNTRFVFDEYLEIFKVEMQKHIDAGKQDEPYPFILDVSQSGMFPINYVVQQSKPVIASFDPFPENYIAYVTSNMNDSILIELINGMTARGFAHKRKLFHVDDIDDAIDWLLSIKPTA